MTAEHSAGAVSHTSTDWHSVPWKTVNEPVRRLQARIVQATKAGTWHKVQALQHLLTHSFSGKGLAVRRVTENQGKNTPGVDKVTWKDPASQWMAIHQMQQRGDKTRPLRRVSIPKSHGTKRPLGIPMGPAYCLSLPQRWGMSIARTIAMRWRHQPTQYTGSGSTGTSPTMPGAPRALSAARSSAVGAFHPPCAASPIAREQLRNNAPSPGHYFYFYTTKIISVFFYGSVEALRGPALGSWLPGGLPTGGGWPSPPEPSLYPGPMPRLPLADGLV